MTILVILQKFCITKIKIVLKKLFKELRELGAELFDTEKNPRKPLTHEQKDHMKMLKDVIYVILLFTKKIMKV